VIRRKGGPLQSRAGHGGLSQTSTMLWLGRQGAIGATPAIPNPLCWMTNPAAGGQDGPALQQVCQPGGIDPGLPGR
jgi:hypothetical protein